MANAALFALEGALAHHQHCLHTKQFVERESATRLFFLADGLGEMNLTHRDGSIDEPKLVSNRCRQRITEAARCTPVERVFDPSSNLPSTELNLFALWINRHDATGSIADEIDNGIRHLQATAVHLGLAEQHNLQALTKLSFAPRLVEEDHVHATRPVAHLRLDHRAAITHRALGHRAHRYEHQRLSPGLEVADPSLVRSVDPAPRIIGDQVENRRDAHFAQRGLLLFTDTFESFDRDVSQFAKRDGLGGHSTPNRYGYSGCPPRCTSTCNPACSSASHARNAAVAEAVD
ncbi:unannotated protein [freshwater metagenome]|uniref:Unannotated protein n=1 Tax=freshwater metagenome TaxID=449393 RepID=A0A6J6XFA4_9ZZZZ